MPKPVATPEQKAEAARRICARLKNLGRPGQVIRVMRVGQGSRPHVAVVRIGGSDYVLKDHAGCDRWFARLLGPLLARREARALRLLSDVPGVPGFAGFLDRRAFLMEQVDAQPYRRINQDEAEWAVFFGRLESMIGEMHRKGITHCDLRSHDNTLVDANGNPAVVDFVASFRRGRAWNLPAAWLFRRLCQVDISAMDKQKQTVAPGLFRSGTTPYNREDEGLLARSARNLGVGVRKLARRLFTGS